MDADQASVQESTRHPGFRLSVQWLTIFCLALLARLAFLQITGAFGQILNDDGLSYDQLAVSLLAGDGFAWEPGKLTAFRPFGYPWFMAGIYALVDRSPAAVQLAQVLLGALTAGLVALLGRRFGGQTVGALAGLAAALHPVLIYSAALIAPEVVAIFLECALLWFALCMATGPRVRTGDAIGFAMAGAGAILVRPELLVVLLMVVAAILIVRDAARPPILPLVAAAALALLLAVAPSALRNWQRFTAFIPFPTIGGVTFWGANNPNATGGWLMPLPEYFPAGEAPELGMHGWTGLTESQSQARFYNEAFDWILGNPADALSLLPKKLVRSWTLSYADEDRANALPRWIDWLNAAFGLITLAGIALAIRHCDRLLVALLLAPVAAWLVKTLVFYGSARQTATVLPVLFIFAALAIAELMEKGRRRTRITVDPGRW